jgi:hypothetical protein
VPTRPFRGNARECRDAVLHAWGIEKELDVLRAVDGQSGAMAGGAESAGNYQTEPAR